MKLATTTLPIVLYHTHCARIARAYAHGGAHGARDSITVIIMTDRTDQTDNNRSITEQVIVDIVEEMQEIKQADSKMQVIQDRWVETATTPLVARSIDTVAIAIGLFLIYVFSNWIVVGIGILLVLSSGFGWLAFLHREVVQ